LLDTGGFWVNGYFEETQLAAARRNHANSIIYQDYLAEGLPTLPAYSPDLTPIEQVFAKLTALLRKMALRSVKALWKALGSITGCASPRNARTSSAMPTISGQGKNALVNMQAEYSCLYRQQ
jgi:hypothetical protein